LRRLICPAGRLSDGRLRRMLVLRINPEKFGKPRL
jgi:hypothetical protein